MECAVAELDGKCDVLTAARAEHHGRCRGVKTWAVRCDEHVGCEPFLVNFAKGAESVGAALLAHLHKDLTVKAELALSAQNRSQSGEVDPVLAFVVRRAAPIDAVFLDDRLPRSQPIPPLVFLSGHDVAVPYAKTVGRLSSSCRSAIIRGVPSGSGLSKNSQLKPSSDR